MANPFVTPSLRATIPPNVGDVAPILNVNPLMSAPAGAGLVATPAALPNVGVSRTLTDVDNLHHLQAAGSGVSGIQNPWLRGIARVADVVGQIAAPNVERHIPGSEGKYRDDLARQANVVQQDQALDANALNAQQTAAKIAQENAQAQKYETQAAENRPFVLTPDQAEAAGVPELAGQSVSARTYEKFFGKTQDNNTRQSVAQGKNDATLKRQDMANDAAAERNAASIASRESIASAADKTRQLVASMHDRTSTENSIRAHSGVTGGANGESVHKVPADITKRAALGSNVIENSDAVESLLDKHPEIVGATGGRYTSVQQMIGSDDPAIAEMGVRMHNIALASNGAHGVRAQGAIEQTEKELFNHFKSGPNAIKAGLKATKQSMQTFLDDEQNYQSTGARTGKPKSSGAGKVIVVNPEDLR